MVATCVQSFAWTDIQLCNRDGKLRCASNSRTFRPRNSNPQLNPQFNVSCTTSTCFGSPRGLVSTYNTHPCYFGRVTVETAVRLLAVSSSTGSNPDQFLQADFWILIRTFSTVRCWFRLAGVWFSCLERLPITQEVAGSSPVAPANFRNSCDCFRQENGIG
jgi:hypothetical protein